MTTSTGVKTNLKWSNNSNIPLNKPFAAKPNGGQLRKLISG